MDCYNQLAEWGSLAYCSTATVDGASPPDLTKVWSDPFYQVRRVTAEATERHVLMVRCFLVSDIV